MQKVVPLVLTSMGLWVHHLLVNVNASRKSDSNADLRRMRETFARHPGAAYQLEKRTGIPRSFITMYLGGHRPATRGKAKLWAHVIATEAARLKSRGTQE